MLERMSRFRATIMALVVIGALALLGVSQLAGASTNFPQTGTRIWGPFEQYWKANGGLQQFGMPLTGVFPYNGYAAQWFERAVFTYNPNNPDPYKVQLQNLGWLAASARCTEAPFARTPSTGSGQYFLATGHNLTGKFLAYWKSRGGLQTFGYPLSEAFTEHSKNKGKDYLVQYFERFKMELHPEAAGTANEVQLGLLGSERLTSEGGAAAFAHLNAPPFYPNSAPRLAAPKAGVYPKTGSAPDYSWVVGSVTDVSQWTGPGPMPMRPTLPPSIHAGPGPIFAPPPPEAMPITYPNGVTVGRAVKGDVSPPLSSIQAQPASPPCSAIAADVFLPTGPVWEREKSKLKDGDYVVVFGHLATPGEVSALGDQGRPYVVDKLIVNH